MYRLQSLSYNKQIKGFIFIIIIFKSKGFICFFILFDMLVHWITVYCSVIFPPLKHSSPLAFHMIAEIELVYHSNLTAQTQ